MVVTSLPADAETDVYQSSALDFFFAGAYDSTYNMMYYGTEGAVFRQYPWISMDGFEDSNFNQYSSGTCTTVKGMYEPRCRGWYINAKASASQTTSFTTPYIAAGSGELCITISCPVIDDSGTFHGVIGTDPLVTGIQNAVNVDIGTSGYAFITDLSGTAIFHPEADVASGQFASIDSLESSELAGSAFYSADSGQLEYNKGGDTWYMSFERIPSVPYKLAVVVSKSDVTAAATEAEDAIAGSINGMIIIVCCIVAAVAVLTMYMACQISNMISLPVEQLTEICIQLRKGEYDDIEIDQEEPTCRDVVVLREAFKSMLTSVRFGSEAYYAGNVEKAKKLLRRSAGVVY